MSWYVMPTEWDDKFTKTVSYCCLETQTKKHKTLAAKKLATAFSGTMSAPVRGARDGSSVRIRPTLWRLVTVGFGESDLGESAQPLGA
jgi:hypothetical protein